jgi:hypothetical protein
MDKKPPVADESAAGGFAIRLFLPDWQSGVQLLSRVRAPL